MFLSIFTGYTERQILKDLNFQSKFEFFMLKLYKERGCSIFISPLPSPKLSILLHQAKASEIFRKKRT